MKRNPVCIVCRKANVTARISMCQACGEAFDRFNRRDSTTLGLIRWAAGRAWRCSTERLRDNFLVKREAGK